MGKPKYSFQKRKKELAKKKIKEEKRQKKLAKKNEETQVEESPMVGAQNTSTNNVE